MAYQQNHYNSNSNTGYEYSHHHENTRQKQPYDTYYHYTDKQGAKGIRQSKTIVASDVTTTRDDAVFGDGVYFTKMNPYHNSKDEIAKNNWDTSAAFYESQVDSGKVDYVVKVQIPKNEAPQRAYDPSAPHRSVYVFDDDVDLNRYKSKIEKVKNN